jgi:hypothetical protein
MNTERSARRDGAKGERNGPCLAFNNSTLSNAIAHYALLKDKRPFTQGDTDFTQFSAWVRDHEGNSNPHTKINKEL